MKRHANLLPVLAVVLGAALGASSGTYIKSARISSLAMTGFRMGVPFLFFLPGLIRRGMVFGPSGMRASLWITSGINAVRMFLFVTAYKLTPVGTSVVLLYLWPVFALLFDGLRLRRAPTFPQAALIGLAFAGVVVMNLHRGFSLSSSESIGSVIMIVSAGMFAVTSIRFKKILGGIRETDAIYFQNAIGAIVFIPFLLAEAGGARPLDLALGLIYGLSVGTLGFTFYFYAMKRLTLFQYGALSYTEVPLATLIAVIVLGEAVVVNQVAGGFMVLAASFLSQQPAFSAKPDTPR